jgi:predicted metalloprotease with PDZ domain
MNLTIQHRVFIENPSSHLVEIETTVRSDAALPSPLTLFMPVWTPGSYLVREYARHVEGLTCDAPARATRVRKNAWRIDAIDAKSVRVRYRIHCNELTVRTNHVDETHAYLNGAATFLAVEGHESNAADIELVAPEGWRVATALPPSPAAATPSSFRFRAPDLDTLVDCPIEIGEHVEHRFDVLGKPHRFAVWPARDVTPDDLRRLVTDTTTILETEARLFGGELPYDEYLFLLHLSSRGRGGLEHKTCASLLASPSAFASHDGYLDLLSLVAHEAFHLWNVKRIRPGGLTPYRYEEENYTRLLWWFEGATSYFDWRILRLARLCSVPEYLDHLAAEVGYLDATHGRLVHSLEEASFDAWIKLYRPDENSANSSISYYRKGELVCALLDIEIRARSDGRASLDDVLAHLWKTFGARGEAVPEGAMQDVIERATGTSVGDLLDAWVRAPGDIDYAPTFARVGLQVERGLRNETSSASLGLRLRGESRAIVASVARGAAAHRAGIDPSDEILAIDGRRVEGSNVEATLVRKKAGDVVEVLVARDGRTLARSVTLDPPRRDRVRLIPLDETTPAMRAAFGAWLGQPHPSWETT